ncbi:MAG: DNA mismatch repair protein MutL, partial [Candidatus Marivariicella framensis]
MSEKITLLPDHVANQIAAGEVIQRPSSIVKELMENAIDAGATNINLIVKDAGKTLVQVIDNGNGIPHNDLSLAFQRHATSKIKTAEDLFSLKTKGFRGEALASISAISHIYMVSRTSKDSMAKFIKIAGNKIENEDFKVAPLGTSFSVKNLFYNIPARRNFLKSDSVELRHIIDEFNRVAIAHPNINFSFIQNKKEVFDLKKTNLRKRISSIFGSKVSSLLVPIQENTPVAKISGFIIKPSGSRKSRGQQFFFVNNRYIRSPFLNHSVNSAFEGLLSSGYHPGYFIILEVNPNKIDVNIHPTKTEIKFEDEQSLYSIL